MITAGPLIRRLIEDGREVCLSTTTRSGYTYARESLDPAWPNVYLPLDWPSFVRRAVDKVRPDLFVLVETDIWPNFLAGLARRNIPAVLVGGRVSPRSLRGYRLIKGLWGRALNLFRFIGCQTPADRDRMLSLGASPEKTVVTGNLKYDRPLPETGPEIRARLIREAGLPEGTWLVAGSTHPGEDEIVLETYRALKGRHPDLCLLLAPRNRQRFEAAWRLIRETGRPAARRSASGSGLPAEIFLLDTLGELDRFYELADVVFVGKSLNPSGEGGGHNVLEPAARAKPVLFGPRMHNFPEAARLLIEGGGGRQAADPP